MDTKRVVGGAIVLVAVVTLLALVFGAASRSETVVDDEGTFDPNDISEQPLVVDRIESGGFELFGIAITGPDRWLSVGLAVRPECVAQDAGGTRLLGDGECGDYGSLAGPLTGSGRTREGVSWVAVRIDVDEDCFRAVEVGDRWPPTDPACP